LVVAGGSWAGWYWSNHSTTATVSTSTTPTTQSKTTTPETRPTTPTVQGMQLDTSKSYGNKYADGVLPVGDGKYVTTGPKQGYVYACSQYAQNLASTNGGAMTRGPWFSSDGKTWNITKKVNVLGTVYWHGNMTDTVSGSTRTIVSNDLPINDPTGTFPIQSSDPAYQYDRNPNTITAQSYTFSLPANPTYGTQPNCIGGTVGIMTTGVEIFSAFDAGGRDAGAWEVQDGCQGHPQEQGAYHYHTLSSCINNRSVHDVIGFALDGFPITGPNVGTNNILTSSDLDECHGIVSQITLDGKSVTMYHYVMTEDFPYSVSCYRGTAIQPPGLQAQQQAQQGGQIPNRQQKPPQQ
ncbi:MAG TPA: YHYH protein, partial [Candidatus Saccharimonadales bacterium]|nr:YHYH protein [Candidatus Saccharimonadales bacterium]